MASNKEKIAASAMKHLQKGALDKAVREFEKILEIDPNDERTLQKVGDLYARMNRTQAALGAYRRVVDLYSRHGFYAKAIAVLNQILKLEPDQKELHGRLAEMYQQLGLLNETAQQYRVLYEYYEETNRKRDALDVLRRLSMIDRNNLPVRIRLAESYIKEGMRQEGLDEYERLADDLKLDDRQDEYVRVLDRLLHHFPAKIERGRELAALYLERGDTHKSLTLLKAILKERGDDAQTLDLLARAFKALNQLSKTITVLKEMARLFHHRGDTVSLLATHRRILEIDPENAESRRILGEDKAEIKSARETLPPERESRLEILDDAPSSTVSVPGGARSTVPPAAAAVSDQIKLITEAEVFIKYGLHDQAEQRVRAILSDDPNNLKALGLLRHICEIMEDAEQLAEVDARIEAVTYPAKAATGASRAEPVIDFDQDVELIEDGPDPSRAHDAKPEEDDEAEGFSDESASEIIEEVELPRHMRTSPTPPRPKAVPTPPTLPKPEDIEISDLDSDQVEELLVGDLLNSKPAPAPRPLPRPAPGPRRSSATLELTLDDMTLLEDDDETPVAASELPDEEILLDMGDVEDLEELTDVVSEADSPLRESNEQVEFTEDSNVLPDVDDVSVTRELRAVSDDDLAIELMGSFELPDSSQSVQIIESKEEFPLPPMEEIPAEELPAAEATDFALFMDEPEFLEADVVEGEGEASPLETDEELPLSSEEEEIQDVTPSPAEEGPVEPAAESAPEPGEPERDWVEVVEVEVLEWEPEPLPSPELKPEPEPGPEPELESEPGPEPEAELDLEPEPEPEPLPDVEEMPPLAAETDLERDFEPVREDGVASGPESTPEAEFELEEMVEEGEPEPPAVQESVPDLEFESELEFEPELESGLEGVDFVEDEDATLTPLSDEELDSLRQSLSEDETDDLEEAEFFVQQAIYSEAMELYRRLASSYPEEALLAERLELCRQAKEREESLRAAATIPPVASAPVALPKAPTTRPVPPPLPGKAAPVDLSREILAGLDDDDDDGFFPVADAPRPVDAAKRDDEIEVHLNLGIAYREMGLLDEAIGEFRVALTSGGPTVRVAVMLALCYLQKKMPERSADFIAQAVNLPTLNLEQFMEIRYDLGVFYQESGKLPEALRQFRVLEDIDPEFKDAARLARGLEADRVEPAMPNTLDEILDAVDIDRLPDDYDAKTTRRDKVTYV